MAATSYAVEGLPSLDDVKENYDIVLSRVLAASAERSRRCPADSPAKLVAVSKTKPVELLQHLYDVAGCRRFGENYFQELVEKSAALPKDIEWHFIGHLQSNKAGILIRDVPNLAVLQTVDSDGLAKKLDTAVKQYRPDRPLTVYLQVNTSAEESKSGVEPDAITDLAVQIHKQYHTTLVVGGLMTIGNADYACTERDFACLVSCRNRVAAALGVAEASLELSMGMSSDFEFAIHEGATTVRVGSSIFGPRQKKI
ncbi:alanine racemase, putative [Bodo saltans]|uniref:Pyridoxal phosphate homeostasis protein n=1 Tax=Bodo saltans TaxID=75058 RepID=A0A0S4JPZ2_BODSA|nr:alanine racemase, putative [Bodo saltans]|eukprot:CUG90572.1 alanine racemase, putative [Bodo saltans]